MNFILFFFFLYLYDAHWLESQTKPISLHIQRILFTGMSTICEFYLFSIYTLKGKKEREKEKNKLGNESFDVRSEFFKN